MYESLTERQKLAALALKYYQGFNWEPKEGDYYTSSRADLELYRIAIIQDGIVSTEYCRNHDVPSVRAAWDLDGFTTSGFGPRRVYVPDWILEQP